MSDITLNWKGFKLPIHDSIVDYLGGVDPNIEWEARGTTGHERQFELKKQVNEQKDIAKNHVTSTEEGKKNLKLFADSATEIMSLMLEGRLDIQKHIGQKHFVFVVGAMRTGGTYLLNEATKGFGDKLEYYNMGAIFDSLPQYGFLSSWKNPSTYIFLLFEIAQFLAWVKIAHKSSTVVKKRIAFGHALPLIKSIFGEYADLLITIRHPIPMMYSFSKVEGFNPEENQAWSPPGWLGLVRQRFPHIKKQDWESMGCYERALFFWENYYADIAPNLKGWKSAKVFRFGEDMGKQLEDFLYLRGIKYNPNPFVVKNEGYPNFLSSDYVDDFIERVRMRWEAEQEDFPEIKKI